MIESLSDGDYYKGITENPGRRLEEHNAGLSFFTSRKMPWVLSFIEVFDCRRDALIREKQLKRQNKRYLAWLFDQASNLLNTDAASRVRVIPDDPGQAVRFPSPGHIELMFLGTTINLQRYADFTRPVFR
ncbi:MAG: GIY-YIG nuclease family protein [Chitinophagaceae bacterium]|nr:MAG: GIY-YIG nuclease family protein [Chitinophagaceae bacterium]